MSRMLKLGIDVDGVLADFVRGFYSVLNTIEPRITDLNEEPTCWDFSTEQFGYTKDQDREAWRRVLDGETFWYNLKPLLYTENALAVLTSAYVEGHDVYFLTSRGGKFAHQQSFAWLVKNGYGVSPQVLLTNKGKGGTARNLGLTHFVDDKPENCFEVAEQSPKTRVFMLRQRWNDHPHYRAQCASKDITIVTSLKEFFDALAEEERVNAIVV